jgi:hypothetical protein
MHGIYDGGDAFEIYPSYMSFKEMKREKERERLRQRRTAFEDRDGI